MGHEAAVFAGNGGSRPVLQVVPFLSAEIPTARLLAARALPTPLPAPE